MLIEATVEGTIRSDGTLVLDQKLNLLPGPVTVIVRKAVESMPIHEDWFQFLQRLRAEREAAGYPFMDEQETKAYVKWLRDEEPEDRVAE